MKTVRFALASASLLVMAAVGSLIFDWMLSGVTASNASLGAVVAFFYGFVLTAICAWVMDTASQLGSEPEPNKRRES